MRSILVGVVLVGSILSAQAQTSRALFARESRSVESQHRAQRMEGVRSAIATSSSKTSYDVSVGLAYTDAEAGGHAVNAPFEVAATLLDGNTLVRLYGDGYSRVSAGGASVSGLADIEMVASHAFFPSQPGLRFGLGLKIGTGGDVGSESDGVIVTGSYKKKLDHGFIAGASVKVRHDVNGVPAGVNANVLSGGLQLAYAIPQGKTVSDVFVQLGRGRRVHGAGSSFAIFGSDLKLSEQWGATVNLVRGLTSGSRDTTFEVDLTRSF